MPSSIGPKGETATGRDESDTSLDAFLSVVYFHVALGLKKKSVLLQVLSVSWLIRAGSSVR